MAVHYVGGGRLRLDDESLGPPLHENQTLDHAGVVQGHRVVLEPGQAPTDTQVCCGELSCDHRMNIT